MAEVFTDEGVVLRQIRQRLEMTCCDLEPTALRDKNFERLLLYTKGMLKQVLVLEEQYKPDKHRT